MTTSTRPFRILGIQQIAIGGEDKARLRKLWVDLLGFNFKVPVDKTSAIIFNLNASKLNVEG
ncbi:MAG: VOC family protein, partial [Polynucleobacter sp.]|nr:VOC family protein [Polynucleobacter sp.]